MRQPVNPMLKALLLLFPLAALAQSDLHPEWNVLYGHAEFENADQMLSNYLRKLAAQSGTDREKAIAALKTSADVEQHQRAAGKKLRQALGEFPARTPLRAVTTGKLKRDGYTIEKIIFESRPRYYVTANVYVPQQSQPPFPAVVCPVGHWGDGKAFEDYQRLGIYLARRGFLVLIYDAPGQGERLQYYSPVMGRSLIDPGGSTFFVTIEHGLAGAQSLLTPRSFAQRMVWDGVRAIDYLEERGDVDRRRIACTGTSGGGLQTEVLSAVDDRIQVSIPVCYGGCAPDTPTTPGMGIVDVDLLIAPRPLLMIEATGDARAGVLAKQQRHQAVASAYQVLGAADRTRFLIAEGPHGYGENMRQEAFKWLSRWWRSETPAPEALVEAPAPLEPEAALYCTTTGQVRTALGGETVFSLNRAEGRIQRQPMPAAREAWTQWREQLKKTVAVQIGCVLPQAPLNPRILTRADKGTFTLEKIVFYSEPEIFVPGLLLLPKRQGPSPGIVFVPDEGNSGAVAEKYLRPLAEAGHVVLSIDPRGLGETAPASSSTQRNYRGFVGDAEVGRFYEALRGGNTLVGLRTRDVLGAVEYLLSRKEVDRRRISAAGHGLGGLLVLYAAALDERIQSAAVTGALLSYSAITESELYTHRFGAFVPGVLRDFDLPEVAALVAPRRLLLLNIVDQLHRRVDPEEVHRTYQPAAGVYRIAGAGDALQIDVAATSAEIVQRYRSTAPE
jgi:cephalosporin-C deacetylase-like acetyl esterase